MTGRELGKQISSYTWLKAVGSTLVITLFFVAYFTVLNHPIRPVVEMPVLTVDKWIPVLPSSVWIYFSLWVYICLPVALMGTLRQLAGYLVGAVLLSTVALVIFIYFPTSVPAWPTDWSRYPAMAFLKSSDASGNACPSLHVAFSIFSACWLQVMLRRLEFARPWYWLNWAWALAIVVSTLTTRQHVFIDVVCGSGLGLAVAGLNIRYTRHETVPHPAAVRP